jgi:hypothetical protein
MQRQAPFYTGSAPSQTTPCPSRRVDNFFPRSDVHVHEGSSVGATMIHPKCIGHMALVINTRRAHSSGPETRKWRRKALETLNPRPEMAWPWKHRTPRIRRRSAPRSSSAIARTPGLSPGGRGDPDTGLSPSTPGSLRFARDDDSEAPRQVRERIKRQSCKVTSDSFSHLTR